MADIADRSSAMPGSWAGRSIKAQPILWAWLLIAAFLALCWCGGISPNGDFDDILKLMQIRGYLETGSWFDRTIPGVLQPEPFASHWPRILDLPYAAAAWLLTPLAGSVPALATAAFAVPLLLLLAALASFHRIMAGLDFERPQAAFFLALVPAMGTLFEFAPGRIDYHNVQVVFLLATIALTMVRSTGAAMVSGAIVALALAASTEFALFFALVMAIHAFEFIRGGDKDGSRLGAFGTALAVTAVLAYTIVVAPDSYSRVACDTYSPPHLLGLVLAGASFVAAAGIRRRVASPFGRALTIALPAVATVVFLAFLFPQCLGGPYAVLDAYLRDVFLGDIAQEQSLFARTDFVLSTNMAAATALFVGATAPAVIVIADRFRDRNLLVVALFALLALAQAVLYFRYFRYVPILAAPGLILVPSVLAPGLRAKGALLAGRFSGVLPSPTLVAAPGLIIAAGLVVFHLAAPAPSRVLAAATFAGSCDLSRAGHYAWPQGSRVMAPPLVNMVLLPDMQAGAAVVAVPYHTGGLGVERAYRFLDPMTTDPRVPLDASLATHVAICALRGEAPAEISARYPFATLLMEGKAPGWLTECPTDQQASIRLYRYTAAGTAADTCPAPR